MTGFHHSLPRRWALLAATSLLLPFGHAAGADTLPATARIVVGFPPGGSPDIIARRLAEGLQGRLARSVIVDNRPGAGGRIAVNEARTAAADGTTLLLNPSGVLAINPHTYRQLNYDPFQDFTPLGMAAQVDYGFAVGPAVPAEVRDIAAFARWAAANPERATFASPAAGAAPHFVGDALGRALSIPLTHVPYRGGAAATNDLLGGQVAAAILTVGDFVSYLPDGRVRLLASTGPRRSPFAPEVATFAEQGVSGLEARDWFALYIAGAPAPEVVARVSALVRETVGSPRFREALAASSLEAAASTPEELDRLARADYERWGAIVKESGFVADP